MSRKREHSPFEFRNHWLSKQRRSNNWCVTWHARERGQTARRSLSTADLEEAKVRLVHWVNSNAEMRNEDPAAVYLDVVFQRWWEAHGKTLRSADSARHALLKWSDFFKGALVSEVTPRRLQAFSDALLAAGASQGYLRRTLAVGQSALNWAVRFGELSAAPSVPLPAESEPRQLALTQEEVAWLLISAHLPHERAYLTWAFGTGARPEAILDLTTFQCDRRAGAIKLNPPGRPQTKKRRPTIPMAAHLRAELDDLPPGHVVTYKGRRLKTIISAYNRVKKRAAKELRRHAAGEALQAWRAGRRSDAWELVEDAKGSAARLLESVPYTLRHTLTTEVTASGIPLSGVVAFFGHSAGYKTTERYVHYSPEHLARAIGAVNAYWKGLQTTAANLPGAPSLNPAACESRVSLARNLVELDGIEPTTSTMPLYKNGGKADA